MRTRDYRDLRVWQQAIELVVASYRVATVLPPHERFELARQIRRAAVSVPANIAEGNGRLHRGDYLHHLSFARGSIMELLTHLEIATRLGYVTSSELGPARGLADHVGRMLTRLIEALRVADHGRYRTAVGAHHPPSPDSPVPM